MAATRMVLIADDQATNRALLVRLLNMLGHAAESASNGSEALDKWATGQYALLITDCGMPVMDGFALTRHVRSAEARTGQPRMPILAWTSTPTPDELEKITAAGMDGLLVKPVELDGLQQLLHRHLGNESVAPDLTPLPLAPWVFPASVLDEEVLHRYSGGDRSIEKEILAEFDASSQADAESIRLALVSADPAKVAQCCHRLKGASRMIGAYSLASACARLEQDGRAGDLAGIDAHQEDLFLEYRKLRVVLDAR